MKELNKIFEIIKIIQDNSEVARKNVMNVIITEAVVTFYVHYISGVLNLIIFSESERQLIKIVSAITEFRPIFLNVQSYPQFYKIADINKVTQTTLRNVINQSYSDVIKANDFVGIAHYKIQTGTQWYAESKCLVDFLDEIKLPRKITVTGGTVK